MPQDTLEAAILAAHAKEDRAALVTLYKDAAENVSMLDEKCFFYTQAYIYALETDHSLRRDLQQKLIAYGREQKNTS